MEQLKFNKAKIESLITKIFPDSKIQRYIQFSNGLVSQAFKVYIQKPSKILVIKLSKTKNITNLNKNNQILNYLKEKNLPVPEIFFNNFFDKKFITIMEYSCGEVASTVYKKASPVLKKTILKNAGTILKSIHNVKIPSFWVHQKHEIKNKQEWKKWTKVRIDKYLKFFKNKWSNYYDLLEKELNEFWEILKKEKIDFSPLHWDFHFYNINVNTEGKITGVFDFDNALKGHSLADLGQFYYWLKCEEGDVRYFNDFLKGYKTKITLKELKLIRGYYILHLLAVTRNVWFKEKLKWLIEDHYKMVEELAK